MEKSPPRCGHVLVPLAPSCLLLVPVAFSPWLQMEERGLKQVNLTSHSRRNLLSAYEVLSAHRGPRKTHTRQLFLVFTFHP